MTDLTKSTSAELLKLHAAIGPELRRRGIVRSENITGDVAEYLFREPLTGRQQLVLTPTSTPSTGTASASKSKAAA